MVDSINGAGKPMTSVNEIYVNWKKCTAEEVLKYEKDGKEVPDNILKWAEEVAKIANAPEDVTYEATNGSSDINQITQAVTQEGKDPKNAPTAAQNDRQAMQDGGESLYEQGKAFIDKSKDASSENMKMMISTTINANASGGIAEQSEGEAASTEAQAQSSKKEYDALIEKSKNENSGGLSRAEETRLVILGQQLNKIGTNSQKKLQDMSTQVEALDNSVAAFTNVPSNALDYGAETATIGAELLGKVPANQVKTPTGSETAETATEIPEETTPQQTIQERAQTAMQDMQEAKKGVNIFATLFDKDMRMGLRAGKQGTSTINAGNKGQEALDKNMGVIEDSKSRIGDSQTKVGDVTLVKAEKNNAETNNTNENPDETTNQESNPPTPDNTAVNKGQTLADTTITADANEIIKRKERKGIPT